MLELPQSHTWQSMGPWDRKFYVGHLWVNGQAYPVLAQRRRERDSLGAGTDNPKMGSPLHGPQYWEGSRWNALWSHLPNENIQGCGWLKRSSLKITLIVWNASIMRYEWFLPLQSFCIKWIPLPPPLSFMGDIFFNHRLSKILKLQVLAFELFHENKSMTQ